MAARLCDIAANVRILDLGSIEGFKGKDVSDWCEWLDGRTAEELTAALIGMARMHEATGSTELACKNYQKYLADQKNTGYREFVEMKIGKV